MQIKSIILLFCQFLLCTITTQRDHTQSSIPQRRQLKQSDTKPNEFYNKDYVDQDPFDNQSNTTGSQPETDKDDGHEFSKCYNWSFNCRSGFSSRYFKKDDINDCVQERGCNNMGYSQLSKCRQKCM